MSEPEFPPNSHVSKRDDKTQDGGVHRVTSGDPIRRRRPLRKQFTETFIAGDSKSTMRFVVLDVMLPAAKDMIFEMGSEGLRKFMFGDGRRRGGVTPPQSGPMGNVSYHRMGNSAMSSILSGSQRAMSRQARARHNFDEVVIEQRHEAEEVIDKLYEVLSRYGTVTVADLYELVGLASTHTDHRWGWTTLQGAGVSRIRGGYLLDLPEPHSLD